MMDRLRAAAAVVVLLHVACARIQPEATQDSAVTGEDTAWAVDGTDGSAPSADGSPDTAVADDGDPPIPDAFVPPKEKDWEVVPTTLGSDLTGRLTAIWAASSTDVWFCGFRRFYNLTPAGMFDGGSFDPGSGSMDCTSMWGSSRDDIWSGTNLYPHLLHWDGKAIGIQKSVDRYHGIYGLWGFGPRDVWAVGGHDYSPQDEIILHWDGVTWSGRSTGFPADDSWHGVWGSSPNDVWIGGWRSIAHWNGISWASMYTLDAFCNVSSISGRSKAEVWAVTERKGRVLHYNGTAWLPVSIAGAPAVFAGVAADYDGTAWVVGARSTPSGRVGAILHCSAFACWDVPIPAKSPLGTFLHGVAVAGPGDVWAVGSEGTLLHRKP